MSDLIYLHGFPATYTEADIKSELSKFGSVAKCYIMSHQDKQNNPTGRPRRVEVTESAIVDTRKYAIAKFRNPRNGHKAIDALHQKTHEEGKWHVSILEKGKERKKANRARLAENIQNFHGKNVIVKNFPENWTENNFREVFGCYGEITSVKVDKNIAFVCFQVEEMAKVAIEKELNRVYDEKKLFVTLWRDKDNLERLIKKRKFLKARRKTGVGAGVEVEVEMEINPEYSPCSSEVDRWI